MEQVKINLNGNRHQYKISIGHRQLENCGTWAKKCLSEKTKKIALISNAKIFGIYGTIVENSLRQSGFDVSIWLMKDGERHKNLRSLEKALEFFSLQKLKRTDAVIALGGGVVGDLTGFASAVYLRGTPFLQIPTTLLSMIDSSVGGKTGVNSEFGKNLVGAFHQPHGVLIDLETLKTLLRRELTAGFCEAVKQGAIADRQLFTQTAEFLGNFPVKNFKQHFSDKKFKDELQKLIAAQVSFKAKIVSQDERENIERIDGKSRKVLNFGHTVGHALEKVTDYKYFKHGEAVGYGILAAAELSKDVAKLAQNDLKWLNDVVKLTGNLPSADKIDVKEIIKAISFDKKNVGDTLQWILLKAIGQPQITDNSKISSEILRKSLKKILQA